MFEIALEVKCMKRDSHDLFAIAFELNGMK